MAFGVYVHIPFCASRCDYCDFATWTDRTHLIDSYVDACVLDLERRNDGGDLEPATSVFFGGGTPSLLAAEQLTRILEAIPREPSTEITVECNPDSVDEAKLTVYQAAGVNRVSIGVQSMRTHVLAALGRTHDPANVRRAVTAARAVGIGRVNLDLIYGTPGESLDDWRTTLEEALALEPSHVSAYALTVEPATPLGQGIAAGTRPAPDDDDQADKYAIADDRLGAAGLRWYELSNWSRPGEECEHNLLYWRRGQYVGIGCAAHGYTRGRRWWNVRTPERYLDRVDRGEPTESGAEELEPERADEEELVLALRTREGVKVSPWADGTVRALSEAGLLEQIADRVVLTRQGRLLANEVTVRLLGAGATQPVAASTR
jgi:putative oxygen-independent coproporphyrinogen III oxidase